MAHLLKCRCPRLTGTVRLKWREVGQEAGGINLFYCYAQHFEQEVKVPHLIDKKTIVLNNCVGRAMRIFFALYQSYIH